MEENLFQNLAYIEIKMKSTAVGLAWNIIQFSMLI